MEKAVNFYMSTPKTGQEWILARKHNSATTQWRWISPGDLCVVGNQEIWWGSAGVNSLLPWLPCDLQSIVAITMSSLRNNWYEFVEPVTNLLSTKFYSIMKLFSSLHDFTCLGVFLCIVMDLTYAHSITILGKKVKQNVVFCKFLQFSITAFIQGQEHPLHTSGAQSSFTGMGMTSSKHMVIDVHITCSTQFIAAFEILNLMTVH